MAYCSPFHTTRLVVLYNIQSVPVQPQILRGIQRESLAKMTFLTIALLAVQLAHLTDAQIPKPCAGIDQMTARECCPTPTVLGEADPGPCGVNIGRGSCQPIANLNKEFANDVRENWPLNYFNMTCVCAEQFGGYDCSGCSFAYIGNDCSQKVLRKRKPITELYNGQRVGGLPQRHSQS